MRLWACPSMRPGSAAILSLLELASHDDLRVQAAYIGNAEVGAMTKPPVDTPLLSVSGLTVNYGLACPYQCQL